MSFDQNWLHVLYPAVLLPTLLSLPKSDNISTKSYLFNVKLISSETYTVLWTLSPSCLSLHLHHDFYVYELSQNHYQKTLNYLKRSCLMRTLLLHLLEALSTKAEINSDQSTQSAKPAYCRVLSHATFTLLKNCVLDKLLLLLMLLFDFSFDLLSPSLYLQRYKAFHAICQCYSEFFHFAFQHVTFNF